MKHLLLAALLGLAAAQDPALPDGVRCIAGPPEKSQTKLVECHCPVECVTNPDGTVMMIMKNCKAGRCHEKDCLCHTDESPCPKPEHR